MIFVSFTSVGNRICCWRKYQKDLSTETIRDVINIKSCDMFLGHIMITHSEIVIITILEMLLK